MQICDKETIWMFPFWTVSELKEIAWQLTSLLHKSCLLNLAETNFSNINLLESTKANGSRILFTDADNLISRFCTNSFFGNLTKLYCKINLVSGSEGLAEPFQVNQLSEGSSP